MLGALDQMMDLASTHAVYPILLTLPPRAGNSLLYDQTPPTTESWNEALRSYAISNGYEWIDLYQAFLNQPDWESLLDDGGLHLSQEGQVFVAETVYSVLAPLLE